MLDVGGAQEPDRQQDLLVLLDEAVPVSSSIRAHGKEVFGGNQSGVEAPRTFHEVGFTVEGLVKDASNCLGISSIRKDNQGSLSGEVPVLITLGEVLMHLGNNPEFKIANCAGHRVLNFHEGLERLFQMELIRVVAGIGKDPHFHGILGILDFIWVSATFDLLKVPGHGTFLGAECIVEGPVKRNSDHRPQRSLAAPRANLVCVDSELCELGREIGDASYRSDCGHVGILPGQQEEPLHFASKGREPLLESNQSGIIGRSRLGFYGQSQTDTKGVVTSFDNGIELEPGGGRCGG